MGAECSGLKVYGNGLEKTVQRMLAKDFKERLSVRECLDEPFFQALDGASAEMPSSAVEGFATIREKSKLTTAILMDLVDSQNLAQMVQLNVSFSTIDADKNGLVSAEELRQIFTDILGAEKVDSLLKVMLGDDGLATYTEFMAH